MELKREGKNMFCEFSTSCVFCGTTFVVSAALPNSLTAVPDGSFYNCACPKCGLARAGLVPHFDPHRVVDVRSLDSVEGSLRLLA
jgi:hypothetical protein